MEKGNNTVKKKRTLLSIKSDAGFKKAVEVATTENL